MRLIDADALMDKITSETIFIKDGLWVSKIIDDAPTIEPSGDLISRADAIEAVMNTEPVVFDSQSLEPHQKTKDVIDALSALPSAEAVHGWIPFTRRPMTEEEQKDYPNCTFMFDCVLPDDGDEILVSNGRFVWMDTFCNDIDGCYLDGGDDIDEDMAWMPLPKPYKGGEK